MLPGPCFYDIVKSASGDNKNAGELMAAPTRINKPFPLRSMAGALARAEAKHGSSSGEAAACREVLERYIRLMSEPNDRIPDTPQEDSTVHSIRGILARMEAKYGGTSKEARAVREALVSVIKLSKTRLSSKEPDGLP